jgi:hypothetical protein
MATPANAARTVRFFRTPVYKRDGYPLKSRCGEGLRARHVGRIALVRSLLDEAIEA